MDIKGKRFLVVGFGVSGEAAAHLLIQKGARVLVIDESKEKSMKRRARRKKNAGIQIQLGVSSVPKGRFDGAIMSPGVDPRHRLGREVADLDVPVVGELEFASWFCSCPMIAITGTNGKTTTTELIHRALRANRRKALAAGNIGLPLSEAALESDHLDYLAVEVSSFQLETIDRFHPPVSVMMNITPDHLDRHVSMEEYARAKAAMWRNQEQEDTCVVNTDTERLLKGLGFSPPGRVIRYSLREETVDLWFDGERIRGPIVETAGIEARLDKTRLRGPHNAENIMATLAVSRALGLDLVKTWKAACDYRPLDHRLQTVGIGRGIEFVNDSKATNVDAMEKAVLSFNQPVILIAGGKDKGFDFHNVAPVIKERVKACILIGEMREHIYQAWKDVISCVFANSLEEAAQMAARMGEKGDVVLLSPGCSSYDMFENYKDRGKVFCRAVQSILDSSEDSTNPTRPSQKTGR